MDSNIIVNEEKLKLCRCKWAENDMCSTYRACDLSGEPFCINGTYGNFKLSLPREESPCNCGNEACDLAREMGIDGQHFCHGNVPVDAKYKSPEIRITVAPMRATSTQTKVEK